MIYVYFKTWFEDHENYGRDIVGVFNHMIEPDDIPEADELEVFECNSNKRIRNYFILEGKWQ